VAAVGQPGLITIDFIVGVGIALAIEVAGFLAMAVLLTVVAVLWEVVEWLLR
jgi:hypothetical protein